MALLVDAAAVGGRNVYSLVLDGLVRPGRHARLFELAKAAVAQLP